MSGSRQHALQSEVQTRCQHYQVAMMAMRLALSGDIRSLAFLFLRAERRSKCRTVLAIL